MSSKIMSSKIKIFSKSKEGLKFVPFGIKGVKPIMMSWDEFNNIFEYDKDDKTVASLKTEWVEKYKELDKILDVTTMQLLHSNASQKDPKEFLISVGGLGSNIKRISEILSCTKNEVIQLVVARKELFFLLILCLNQVHHLVNVIKE